MLRVLKNIAGKIKMEIIIWLRFIYPNKIFSLNGIPVLFNVSSRREMLRGWQYAKPLKEPGTYEWLDSFVGNNDILYDIGCNTGGYAMYAAIKYKNINVFCFDPDVQNIGAVNKNIFLNKLAGRVLALCIAVSNRNKLDQLNIFSKEAVLEPGYSGNSVATSNRSGSHEAI